MRTTAQRPYDETLAAVRDELVGAGFGVLTEVDLKATLKKKRDVIQDARQRLSAMLARLEEGN